MEIGIRYISNEDDETDEILSDQDADTKYTEVAHVDVCIGISAVELKIPAACTIVVSSSEWSTVFLKKE